MATELPTAPSPPTSCWPILGKAAVDNSSVQVVRTRQSPPAQTAWTNTSRNVNEPMTKLLVLICPSPAGFEVPADNSGDLGTITYSDGTMPSVASVYDRRGRKTSVVSGAETATYTYNDAGQLLTESFPNTGSIVTNAYDGVLRRSTLSSPGASITYSYDSASRLNFGGSRGSIGQVPRGAPEGQFIRARSCTSCGQARGTSTRRWSHKRCWLVTRSIASSPSAWRAISTATGRLAACLSQQTS